MTENNDIKVRIGAPEDEEGLMRLARLVNDENGVFRMNDDKVRAVIKPALYLHGGIVGVIGPRDNLEAGVVLRISQYWYSDVSFLEEMCVFVHPDYRAAKGGRARKLVEFSKKVSENLNMPLMMGILSNSRTEAKTKLYERQFGSPAGAFFLYGIKTGTVPQQEAS